MRPPLVVSIPHTSRTFESSTRRGAGRSLGREDEISMISFESTSVSTANIIYSKYHPIIWMLLMFMAVSLHARYVELFYGEDQMDSYEQVQRKVMDTDMQSHGVDLSRLVLSLTQSEDDIPLETKLSNFQRSPDAKVPADQRTNKKVSLRSAQSDKESPSRTGEQMHLEGETSPESTSLHLSRKEKNTYPSSNRSNITISPSSTPLGLKSI